MSEFLAEAQVLITPNTAGFRAALEAELLAATRGLAVSIPVSAATIAGPQLAAQTAAVRSAAAEIDALTKAQNEAAVATTTVTRTSTGRTAAAKLEARAATLLATAQEEVLNATTALGAAQVTATRSAAALAAARRAEAALTREDSAATAQAVVNTLALADAENTQAAAALRAAKATEAHGASMSFLGRGAGATGLSMLGVRGATLAANSAFLAGAAAAVSFAKSIQLATSFNQELNVFRVTVGATQDEMKQVSDTARALGRDISLPGVSAIDAAEAMTELAKAGLSVQDSIDGARGVLQLATAAQLSNADATTLAASALNAFGLGGGQAVHVADLLANAANNAQGGIEDMGLALRQSAAVARQVGFSLDDTVALLTLLARNGLQGSDAGTALRTSLIRLINPTKEARNILADLNIQLRDQQGNLRPEVFAEFAAATKNLTKAQQDARAAIVFGQDAIRAEAILGREGARGLDQMRVALEKQGTAADVAAARNVGLGGAVENLKNQLSNLGLTIGEAVTPAVEDFVGGLADIVSNTDLAVNKLILLRAAIRNAFPSGGDPNEGASFFDRLNASATDLLTGSLPEQLGRFGDEMVKFQSQLEDLTGLNLVNDDLIKQSGKNLGAETRSAIEDASREAVAAANDFGNKVAHGIEDAFDIVDAAVVHAISDFRKRQNAAIRQNQGQLAGLDEAMNKILAGGGSPQQQIANLRKQAQRQQRIIDIAGPNAAGGQLKARRQAQQALAQIQSQIDSLENEIVADQQKAASAAEDRRTKIQQARDAADQAFIDGISGKLAGIDNRILAAETKDALGQQIRLEKVKRDALIESISQVRQTVKNAKDRAAELRSLTAELIRTNGEITSLTKEQRESEEKRLEDARNAITEKLAKQTQLAELRGDDQAELAAINRQIKDAQKRVAAAKKAKKGVLDEQIALQRLINQRNELIKKIRGDSGSGSGSDATGGTTLADLFREQQRISNQASTVGRRPQDLTTSAANAGIRGLVEQRLTLRDDRQSSAERAAEKQAAATDRLINSLDLLRETIVSGGNRSTAVARRGTGFGEAVNEHLRYVHATTARKLVEEST